ncbi:MAG TPA: response regulator [Bryobacteraceae bacterium]|jgi:two-component system NtrC family sensor kinase|nr:response regulator [Bryobacteraceae bacterium]
MEPSSPILIVEDSETQAMQLRFLLEEEGWSVARASSGEDALDGLNRWLPALIIADYHLPGIRGDELCRRIRMNVRTRGVPILMLTMDQTRDSESAGLDSGADDYVAKSVAPEILMLRVRTLLRNSNGQASVAAPAESVFRRARLLAIDDSPTYLAYLVEALDGEGYEVTKANCGEAALDLVRKTNFDCVMVDLVMPEMDGVEVCRRINEMEREQVAGPLAAVIMLTSRETKEDMTRGLEAGADDFVGKSCDLAVLKARIRALLRRKFFQEENQRIIEELKNKELEAVRSRADRTAAEARAAMAEDLAQINRELEQTNRTLKATQAHLIQSEKMASLGQLVAGIAHEINNPLAFVLNNMFVVREGLKRLAAEASKEPASPALLRIEKLRTRIEEMQEGAERVKDLVSKLRTFSRLDEGTFKVVDIHESIESVLLFLRHKMEGRIEVERRYRAVEKLSCFAGELNQVLMNVIANAIDSIEGPGRITLTTAEENGHFVIRVQDTGSGIPEAIRTRIFEPFFTTKPVGQGTGLGLAISYGIVKAHKGSIEFVTKDGEGTEFILTIPTSLQGVA